MSKSVSRFVVCYACDGRGLSSAYLGAFTAGELDEMGEDFAVDYFAGRLDRACETCGGNRVLPACASTLEGEEPCPMSADVVDFPYGRASVTLAHCSMHLTDDEAAAWDWSLESWGEFHAGC